MSKRSSIQKDFPSNSWKLRSLKSLFDCIIIVCTSVHTHTCACMLTVCDGDVVGLMTPSRSSWDDPGGTPARSKWDVTPGRYMHMCLHACVPEVKHAHAHM